MIDKQFYKGHWVVFREMKCILKDKICPICNQNMDKDDLIYGVATQGGDGPFPDTLIHKSCTTHWDIPFRWRWACTALEELWRQAQDYRGWYL